MKLRHILEMLDLQDACDSKVNVGKCTKNCSECEYNYDEEELDKVYRQTTEECWDELRRAWKRGDLNL